MEIKGKGHIEMVMGQIEEILAYLDMDVIENGHFGMRVDLKVQNKIGKMEKPMVYILNGMKMVKRYQKVIQKWFS
jgi:hypothetical protein